MHYAMEKFCRTKNKPGTEEGSPTVHSRLYLEFRHLVFVPLWTKYQILKDQFSFAFKIPLSFFS